MRFKNILAEKKTKYLVFLSAFFFQMSFIQTAFCDDWTSYFDIGKNGKASIEKKFWSLFTKVKPSKSPLKVIQDNGWKDIAALPENMPAGTYDPDTDLKKRYPKAWEALKRFREKGFFIYGSSKLSLHKLNKRYSIWIPYENAGGFAYLIDNKEPIHVFELMNINCCCAEAGIEFSNDKLIRIIIKDEDDHQGLKYLLDVVEIDTASNKMRIFQTSFFEEETEKN